MKLKLHNKYEIKIKGKTYTAYNTLLKTVYNKIANLQQFTSHIALGTGSTALSFTDTQLGAYAKTYAATTEEINTDVSSNNDLYIKKLVALDDSNQDSFSFSELGLTDSSSYNPTVFNHVLLKDEDDNVLTITRDAGEPIEIRVTIYLELTAGAKALFTAGSNKLIKRILGEDFVVADNKLYAIRGNSLSTSAYVPRTLTDTTSAVQFSSSITYGNSQDANVTFIAELGAGETEEILGLYDGDVCIRCGTYDVQTANSETLSDNPTDAILEIDENVKSIESVTDSNNTTVTGYDVVKYSKNFGDKLTGMFDQTFTSSTTRVIAKDGKTIAFITNSYTYVYTYNNYTFTKINSSLIPHSNIISMQICGNIIVCILSQSPYIQIFEITDGNAVKYDAQLNYYDMTSYGYSWLSADSIVTENNKILVGLILNTQEKTPLLLTLVKNQSGDWVDTQVTHPTLDYADKVISLYKNNYNPSTIYFLTSKYNNSTTYLCQEYNETTNSFTMNSTVTYAILNSTQGITTGGRIIMSEKSASPYLRLYYAPSYDYAGDSFLGQGSYYLSYNGEYLAFKDSNNAYHVYNTHQKGEKEEFISDIPSYVTQSTITDLAFVGDILLVFTSSQAEPLYGIALKNSYTRLDKMADNTETYDVAYKTYNLPGGDDEGVKLTLTLGLGESE